VAIAPILAQAGPPADTLGGSALASWTPLWVLVGIFALVVVLLSVRGRPDGRWGSLAVLSRAPHRLTALTGVPAWAATAIGVSLFGLLVAGQGFYDDVAWHIALGRDDEVFTAPHTAILLGLVLVLGGAVLGTFVATMDRVEGALRVGNLRVPRSLVPLWALGLGAVAGFPLDEVWHAAYGIDVTMWSPTHMLMILGATFVGLAAWLVLAEAGVRPTDGRWARGLHVVAGWLTLQGLVAPQGEFTFGVPQFSQLFHPILICLAAGMALVAMRLVHGRGWTLGIVAGSFLLMGSGLLDVGGEQELGPVETRHGGLFIASALLVELAAAVLGTQRRLRFALASGALIGTAGLAAEWAWNRDAYQPWTSALLPEAVAYGLVAATGAAVLGAAFARGVIREADAGTRIPRVALAVAALACVTVVLLPMRRPTGDVEAAVRVEPAASGTATVVATLTPADAADDAYWFQAAAWQGGGLELADMEPTGTPGEWRSATPVPVDGLWKTLLRLHRGAEMMALPVYLPADRENGLPPVAAVDRTQAFESERTYLLRETHEGNGWLSPLVHGGLVAVLVGWAVAFTMAIRHLTGGAGAAPTAEGPSGALSPAAGGVTVS
jgi:hypothetical protein